MPERCKSPLTAASPLSLWSLFVHSELPCWLPLFLYEWKGQNRAKGKEEKQWEERSGLGEKEAKEDEGEEQGVARSKTLINCLC